MAFTYDLATDTGKVRFLINDHDEANVILQDEEIQAALLLNEENVKRAAAAALDVIASNQTMVLKVIRLLDISTDGAAVARSLREHANQLRAEADIADAGEEGGMFDYAEMVTDAFTLRERILKQAQRES